MIPVIFGAQGASEVSDGEFEAQVFTVRQAKEDFNVVAGHEDSTVPRVCPDGWGGVRVQPTEHLGFACLEPLDAFPTTPLAPPSPMPDLPEPAEGWAIEQRDGDASGGLAAPTGGETIDVWLTIYLCPPYCGLMANGQQVYDGAAACGYGLPLGQRFRIQHDPTLRDYVCSDRGLGSEYWVDIFWADAAAGYAWLAVMGDSVNIELLPGSP